MTTHLSATKAVRTFSNLLNRIRYRGALEPTDATLAFKVIASDGSTRSSAARSCAMLEACRTRKAAAALRIAVFKGVTPSR